MRKSSFPAKVLVDLCLLAFPARVRRRVGGDLRQFIMDDYQDQVVRGQKGKGTFWLHTSWGLLANGLGARLDQREAGPPAQNDPRGEPRNFWSGFGPMGARRSLRFAARGLLRNPGFSLTSIFTLGLGIGGVTLIYSVVAPVLLAPLPYPDPGQLVVLYERSPGPEGREGWVSPLTFRDWREDLRVFDDIVSYRLDILNWSDGEIPVLLRGWAVSAGFFPLMGTPMTLGRGFTQEEDRPGAEPVIVISHGFWSRAFGADRDILGKTLTLDGIPRAIVGVAGPALEYPSSGDYWYPAALDYARESRDFRYLGVIGRIHAGAGPAEAQAELDRLSRAVESENPGTNAGWGATLEGLKEVEVGRVRPVLLGMGTAVAILLLIAVGNLMNLTIARGAGRKADTAIRRALGASRPDLARLHVAEAVVLSFAGGSLGLLLAFCGLRALSATSLLDLPRVDGVGLDGMSAGVGLAAALAIGAVLAWVAMLSSGGSTLTQALRDGGAGGMATGQTHRVREVVLASQMALALTLLIGATLLTRSLLTLSRVDAGFDPHDLMTFSYNLPSGPYGEPSAVRSFEKRLMEDLSSSPGIVAAGLVTPIPMEMGSVPSSWALPPDVRSAEAGPVMAHMRTATPGYFLAMGMKLLQGRLLEENDQEGSEPVVLVNQSFVDTYLEGRNPLGVRVTWGEIDAQESEWSTIVGVVGDVRFRSLRTEGEPEIYLPTAQLPSTWGHVVVRSALPREALVKRVLEAVQRTDPTLPLSDIRSGLEIMGSQLRVSRLSVLLTAFFALIATILSMVGILGVLSILVAQRMREIGLRMVLGAGSGSVWRYVLFRGMRPVVLGIGTGLVAAAAGTRLLKSQVFGVSTLDPVAFLLPMGGLVLAALLACLVPAARATAADPVRLLKSE